MRKDSVTLEKRGSNGSGGEKDKKDMENKRTHKSKMFSWNWFRYRRKDNKIDRRAQLEKDMKDNWRELPTTLRRKQKMSQKILDEFMKDPSEPETLSSSSASSSSGGSTSSKPEVIYSQVKKEGKIRDKVEMRKGEELQADANSKNKIPETLAKSEEMPLGSERDNKTTDVVEVYSIHDYEDIKIVKSDDKTRVEIVPEVPTGVEGRTKLDLPSTAENEEWLEKEQQRVMQLLNHAVSEDSLLASTSSGSSSSSEEDLQDDSGTDINNPSSSSSSSSCNDDPISVPIPTIVIDPPINPLTTDKSLNYSNYEIPIQVNKTDETSNTRMDAECEISNGSSSKADSLLTSSEASQEVTSEDSTIPASILFKNSDNEVDEFGFYDIPVSIPRAGLHSRTKEDDDKEVHDKTDEESTMEFYDSVVRDEQKERHSFQVEIEVHRNGTEGKGAGGYPVLKKGERIVDDFDNDDLDEKHLSMDFFVEENFSRIVDRMQFTTGAKWKKALLMQTLGRKPKGMATIVEETSVEEVVPGERVETTPLTVREILRRFEELGCDLLPAEDKSATLKEIYDTLKSLEEKVRGYESKMKSRQQQNNATGAMIQQKSAPRITTVADSYAAAAPHGNPALNGKATAENWNGRHAHAAPPHPHGVIQHNEHAAVTQQQQQHETQGQHDGKHSLLQFAMHHFRASPEKFEMLKTADGSISGSLKVIESLKSNKKSKNKKDKDKDKDKGSNNNNNKENDWTWKEQVDLVKFTNAPVEMSLLRLESPELSELAVECFTSVMRYMGDLPMTADLSEVKCVYTILMHCHKHESLRDEVYCQLMKQTTNNKSSKPDSCQRGWRLFSIVAAYFTCSDMLKPYLFKYLETAAYDKRRAYHGTASVCLQNLRKTFRHGGRKNVPSVEELTAISAGRNSKRQIYQLPGGSERVVNTKSTTVVQDVIEEMCAVINVQTPAEMEEFSLYCIVEGDTFTMPLARDEYILDVTTELHKNQQVFYLIFCRSVWHFPLRLDSQLYIEVVFNQIAPDYLEGLLLVMPGEQLEQDIIYDIAKMAALLHRAADMSSVPTMKETKFLLPKPALAVRDVKPGQWVNMVQSNWREVEPLQTIQAKAQVLEILSKWPLFGSSFFAVKRVSEPKERAEHILALNRQGVHFIDLVTHETLMHYTFSEVISTRKVKSEDGTLFLDMKCGNLMQQRITRLQTDQAHEISRLIRQYITMEQKLRA